MKNKYLIFLRFFNTFLTGSAMLIGHEILVAESDAQTLRIVKEALLQNGFVIHFAHSFELAMQLTVKNKPDLILSEINLADMDGREFMRMVRKTPEISNTPFIFLTSRTLIHDKVSTLEAGADDYITKPFNENELIARIKAVLRRTNLSSISTLTKDDGIKGNLKDIHLIDLIQLLDMGRKTAVIQIEGEGKEGRVYFEGGEVIHAVCGRLFGKEALFDLLSIQDGIFIIHHHITSKIRSIHLSPTNLVMEAMCWLDENKISMANNTQGKTASAAPGRLLHSEGIKELFEKGVIEEHRKP